MMLKIQLCITEINDFLKYIKIESSFFKLFYCIFDHIKPALVSIRDLFQKHKNGPHFE